jgi:hypothetical protein
MPRGRWFRWFQTGALTLQAKAALRRPVDAFLRLDKCPPVYWHRGILVSPLVEKARCVMRRISCLLCVLGTIGITFTGNSLCAATQFAMVTGSVFNKKTGDPLPRATVRLINARTGFTGSQQTDAGGNFTFPSLPPAQDYVLSAEQVGFETSFRQDMMFTVGDSSLVEPPILLSPIEVVPKTTAPPTPQPAPELPKPLAANPARRRGAGGIRAREAQGRGQGGGSAAARASPSFAASGRAISRSD